MKTIDGSQGEGGGQILRTALTLAMCRKISIRIINIRSGRKRSGLMRQHLSCLRAAQSICRAEVIGDELGSQEIEFHPQEVQPGDYHFAIGTAGSTTLLFQTIAPALWFANQPSTLRLEGGTHNQMAPSYDFIHHSYLPVMKSMGYQVRSELLDYGFYPNGGGQWQAEIDPVRELKPLDMVERGELQSKLALATSSKIPEHVAERELRQIQKKCHWLEPELEIRRVSSCGPGNILSMRLNYARFSELFEVVGQVGISAERVANLAIREVQRYLRSQASVGENLADQLLLPMALGEGGEFLTLRPSLHTLTNIAVIQSLLDCEIEMQRLKDDEYLLTVRN